MYWDWHGWPIGAFRTSLCLCAFSKNVLPPVTAPVCLDIHPPPSQGLRRPKASWQQDVISHLLWLFQLHQNDMIFSSRLPVWGHEVLVQSLCERSGPRRYLTHLCNLPVFFFILHPSPGTRPPVTHHVLHISSPLVPNVSRLVTPFWHHKSFIFRHRLRNFYMLHFLNHTFKKNNK